MRLMIFSLLSREREGLYAFRMKNGRETSQDFILISDSDIGGPFETGRISLISPSGLSWGKTKSRGRVKYDDAEHSAEVCRLI